MFNNFSKYPLRRGGRIRVEEEFDWGHCQNLNLVQFNGENLLYWKGYKNLPPTSNPSAIGGARIPINEEWNGYEFDELANPVVDFSTGSWSAPLDLYTNGALTPGGRIGDIASVVFSGQIYMYLNIYDYNNVASNRLALLTSSDGVSFTQQPEILSGGSNFGATVGGLFVNNGVMYMTSNSPKRLRKSVDGVNWTDLGEIIQLDTDPADLAYTGMPVGRTFIYNGYVYQYQPCSRISADWPEAICVWRKNLNDLDDGQPWDEYVNNPVQLRLPDKGGIWQLQPFFSGSKLWGINNSWGMVGEDKINTTTMNTIRDTPYFSSDVEGFKHIHSSVSNNRLMFNKFDEERFSDGDEITIRLGDGFLSARDNPSDESFADIRSEVDESCVFVVERQSRFYLLKPKLNTSLALSSPVDSDFRKQGRRLIFKTLNASPIDNLKSHFAIFEDDSLSRVTIINRETSLSITNGAMQNWTVNNLGVVTINRL